MIDGIKLFEKFKKASIINHKRRKAISTTTNDQEGQMVTWYDSSIIKLNQLLKGKFNGELNV